MLPDMTATMMPNGPEGAAVSCDGGPAAGISVVMVSYRTGPVLYAAIEAVLARSREQAGVVELILIDNGNPPDVVSELRRRTEMEPRLTIVSGHGNVGFARGCNIGARRARGRYLLLLNPDCCLAPGAIPALLAEAEALGNNWMLGCRVVGPDGRDQRGSRRALLTPYTALVEAFRLDRLAPWLLRRHRLNHHDRPLPRGTGRVPAVSGACMMLPATTFHVVGGMDEGYFLHVDDLDLCLRLHRAGIPVYFVPHVEAVHHAGSSRADPVMVEWHKARGFLYYFRKQFHGLRYLPLLVPLGAGILARFGVGALQSLLRSAWRRLAVAGPAALDPPRGNGKPARARPEGAREAAQAGESAVRRDYASPDPSANRSRYSP